MCKLCKVQPATLSHLLYECLEMALIREQYNITDESQFSRPLLITASAL